MEVYTEKDLRKLVHLLHDARASWEDIATQLGLSQGDVDAIAKKFADSKDCLRESLKLWLRGVDPVPTREQLARALQSPPVGREDIAQQVVPGLSKLPKSHQKLQKDSKILLGCLLTSLLITVLALTMMILVNWYHYGGTGIIDLQQQGKSLPKPVLRQLIGNEDKVEESMITPPEQSVGADEVIVDIKDKDTSSPGKSLSLPVLKQELIGRKEEMKVIIGYFIESEVDVVTLYGQAGFGKSEIALHVGHKMLQLGLDVHYIRVEDFKIISSLQVKLMKISGMSNTSMELETWARGLTKFNKTLLILDNVDGQHWVSDTSRRQLKELFLNPLLDHTFNLQVLITSQQDMRTTHVYRSYRLYSLSTKDCVHLMVDHSRNAESESDTADTDDLTVICDLVGNVPFASKILAKTLSSGTSAKYILQELSEKSKLKIIAEEADKVDKDRLMSAIELAFQFVKKECQISVFVLIKSRFPFTLDEASPHITADMMSQYFNYTDFDLYKCLLELTAKSFLEIREYNFQHDAVYHFHELSVDYLKNSNFELTKILQAYWKNRLRSGIVYKYYPYGPGLDNDDYVALTQILNHDDFSFEASIVLLLNHNQPQNLSSAAHVLVSHCEVQDYNSTRLDASYIIKGYTYLLEYVICQEEFPTEWNCMDVISLCLPYIDKVSSSYFDEDFNDFIMKKYLEMGSSDDIFWKHSLRVYCYNNMFTHIFTPFSRGLESYVNSTYDMAIRYLHVALEDTSSPYDFIAYMTLYDIYSKQDNLTGMEESLAGIHKLDFQQINITCYTYSARYEDPHVTTAILFLQQVNETNLADRLRSKLFVATYAKMGCSDLKSDLLNSLFWRDLFEDNKLLLKIPIKALNFAILAEREDIFASMLHELGDAVGSFDLLQTLQKKLLQTQLSLHTISPPPNKKS